MFTIVLCWLNYILIELNLNLNLVHIPYTDDTQPRISLCIPEKKPIRQPLDFIFSDSHVEGLLKNFKKVFINTKRPVHTQLVH